MADAIALSPAQQDLWLHTQLAPDLPFGNEGFVLHLDGAVDVAGLGRALTEIVRRHGALRIAIAVEDGIPLQVVAPPFAVQLPVVDLRGAADADRLATELAADDARRPFDLAREPLWRARLVHIGDERHRFLLTVHHLVADSASIHGQLLPELAALYAAVRGDAAASPPEPTPAYVDAVEQRRALATTADAAGHVEYWRRRLSGPPPVVELPADRARPPVRGFRGARHALALDARLTERLRALSRDAGVTTGIALLAGFASVLHRYTGEADVVLGASAGDPRQLAAGGQIGCFRESLALRLAVGDDPPFRELLRRVDEAVREALDHADVSLQHVVEAARIPPDRGRHPLFSNGFSFVPRAWTVAGWPQAHPDVDPGVARLDLELELRERADDVVGHLTYRTDLFEPATIARLQTHYCTLLDAAATDPDQPLSRLPLLDAHERRLVVEDWNRTARPYPSTDTVHALFGRRVAERPHAIALVAGEREVTYGELNRRARALAVRLAALGVGRGAIVGVAMERSPEAIVGYLAVLQAGGAYLPLNPSDPPERLAFVVADAGASLVLTRHGGRALALDGVPMLEVDAAADVADGPAPSAGGDVTPDDLVYVMYTSGSTGRPKGVAVPHRGVVRLLFAQDYVRLGPDEVILQGTALTFDVSAFEIWGALLHGARLVLYPSAVPTAREVSDLVRRHGVTATWLTTSVFNMVVDEDVRSLAPLRQLVVGGEALSVPHVARAAQALPQVQLVNGYGPTECSVLACCHRIPRPVDPGAASIPIGPPIANATAYVLDRHLSPVPIGVPGELFLGGPGVARGYLNRPELTAERFIADPFGREPGARLYRTGDLARWRADGTIEYLGRLDSQVKIRGVRIELGEIESALAQHPRVREAAVGVHEDATGKRLVGYVMGRDGEAPGVDELREFLRRTLPAAMVPAVFVPMTAWPLTSSGKLDRRALPAPATAPAAVASPSGPPSAAGQLTRRASQLEAELVALWQQLLGGRAVAVTDDFFELGGNSLVAARMIQQVGELAGSAVSFATLYENPTIAGLVQALAHDVPPSAEASAPAMTLNPGGTRPPLVLFHGILNGGALYALRLARHLGPDQPIHVVHPHLGTDEPLPAGIEAMADDHLRVVQALQPRGPYRLLGYCNGGLVAYEAARRLQGRGEFVEMVGLIAAAPMPLLIAGGRAVRRLAGRLGLPADAAVEPVARLRTLVDVASTKAPGRRLRFALRLLARRVFLRAPDAAPASAAPPDSPDGMADAIMDAYYRIIMRYFPGRYQGSVVVFWPEREMWCSPAVALRTWRRLAGGATLHVVPGNHDGIVRDHLDIVARHLETYLVAGPAPASPEGSRAETTCAA